LSTSDAGSRDRILDAALGLIAAGGAAAPSLRRIGDAAGLHNSSLFHHFPGKAALHDALAERVITAAAAHVAPLAADDPPRLATLIDALGDLAEHLAARPAEASFLVSALVSGEAGALARARARAEEALLAPLWEWLVRARDAGAIRRVRPQAATLQLAGLVLLEPARAPTAPGANLRPAAHARRRDLATWVRAALTP